MNTGDVIAALRARWYFRQANSLGARVRVWGKPVVHNWGTMRIGARARLVSTITPLEIVAAGGVFWKSARARLSITVVRLRQISWCASGRAAISARTVS